MFACSYNQTAFLENSQVRLPNRRKSDKFGGVNTSRHMPSELQEMAAMLNAWFKM